MLPPFPIYLSGVMTASTDQVPSAWDGPESCPLGILVQPLTERYLRPAVAAGYEFLAVDNGAFTEIGQQRFDEEQYLRMTREALRLWGDNMLFCTAPDVAFQWGATLARSLPFLPKIRAIGAPAALVLQNGATPENIPWDACDAIFLGGGKGPDTGGIEWKVSDVAKACTREALRRGKWVHMGRVNTGYRMSVAQDFGCGSADGTYLMHQAPLNSAVLGIITLARATAHRWLKTEKELESVVQLISSLSELFGKRRENAINEMRRKRLLKGVVRSLVDAINEPMLPGEDFFSWGKRKENAMLAVAWDCSRKIASETYSDAQEVYAGLLQGGEVIAVQEIIRWFGEMRDKVVKTLMRQYKKSSPSGTRSGFEDFVFRATGLVPQESDYSKR